MRKQDQLQQLIQSLSANEKRYFKLYSSPQSGDKSYLKLFDAIADAEYYDADVISRETGKTKAALGHTKEHLKEVLLRTLRSFNEDSIHDAWYHKTLEEVELLRSKSQYEWALVKIEEGIEKAVAEEAFQYGLILLRLYHSVAYLVNGGSTNNTEQIELEKQLVRNLENEMEYRHLHLRYLHLANDKRNGLSDIADKAIHEFMGQPALTDEQKPQSKKALLLFYRVNAAYNNEISLDKKKSEKYYKAAMQCLLEKPLAFVGQFSVYPMLLAGLVNIYINIYKIEDAENAIDEFEDSLKSMQYVGAANLRFCAEVIMILRMSVFTDGRLYARAISYGRLVQADRTGILKKASAPVRSDFDFFMALSHWRTGDISTALKISQGLFEIGTGQFTSRYVANRCMYLLMQYDMENYTTLAYLLKSHLRWCKVQKQEGPIMIMFNKMVHELCRAANNAAVTNSVLKKYLEAFKVAAATPEKRTFHAFALADWIEKKIK